MINEKDDVCMILNVMYFCFAASRPLASNLISAFKVQQIWIIHKFDIRRS